MSAKLLPHGMWEFGAAQHLTRAQTLLTFIHAFHCDPEFLNELFKLIVQNDLKSKPLQFQWVVESMSRRFSDVGIRVDDLIMRKVFMDSESNVLKTLTPVIESTERIQIRNNSSAAVYARLLNTMRQSYQALFYSFYERFRPLIKEIGVKRLAESLGDDCMFFLSDDDLQEVMSKQYMPVDPRNIIGATLAPKVSLFYQSQLVRSHPYPSNFFKIPSSEFLTMANTCINHELTPVDMIFFDFSEKLIGGELDKLPQICRIISPMVPYFIIAMQPVIYQNPSKYSKLLKSSFQPGPGSSIVGRFRNDLALLDWIKSRNDFSISTFHEHSLALLVNNGLDINILSKPLYSYSDNDRMVDSDYLSAFDALFTFIDNIQSSSLPIEIVNAVDRIQSPRTKQTVLIDLFSLIFMENHNGLICNYQLAKQTIQFINQNINNPYIKKGEILMEEYKVINECFEDTFIPMLEAAFKGDWKKADFYTPQGSPHRDIFELSYAVHNVDKTQKVSLDLSKKSALFNLELGFSLPNHQKDLEYGGQFFEEYSSIISNRPGFVKPNDVQFLVESAAEFDTHPIPSLAFGLLSTSRDRSPHLESFVKYIVEYLNCCFDGKDVTEDEMQFSLWEAFNSPIKAGHFDMASRFAESNSIDLFGYILQYIKYFDDTDAIIDTFSTEYPIECQALALSKQKPQAQPSTSEEEDIFSLILKESTTLSEIEDIIYQQQFSTLRQFLITNATSINPQLYEEIGELVGLINPQPLTIIHREPTKSIQDKVIEPAKIPTREEIVNDILANEATPEFIIDLTDDFIELIIHEFQERPFEDFMKIAKLLKDTLFSTTTNDFISRRLRSFEIKRQEDEIKFRRDISLIQVYSKDFDSEFIQHLSKVLEYSVFAVYGPYTCRDMTKISVQFDLDDEITYFSSLFNDDIEMIIWDRVEKMIPIGFRNEAFSYISNFNLKVRKTDFTYFPKGLSMWDSTGPTSRFLQMFYRYQIIDPDSMLMIQWIPLEQLGDGSALPPMQLYSLLLLNLNKSPPTFKDHKQDLDFVISSYSSVQNAVAHYAAFDEIPESIGYLLKLPEDKQSEAFMEKLVPLSIAFGNLRTVEKNLNEPRLWELLLEFSKKRDMLYLYNECCLNLGRYEESALVSISLFRRAPNTSSRLFYIGNAVNGLCNEDVTSTEAARRLDISVDELRRIRRCAELQLKVTKFLFSKQIEVNYDIIHSEADVVDLGVILLIHRNKELFDAIIEHIHVTPKEILTHFFSTLRGKNPKEVANMTDSIFGGTEWPMEYLPVLLRFLADSPYFGQIAVKISKSHLPVQVKARLFIEFDFLLEALTMVDMESGCEHLVPLIAHRAAICGNQIIITQCERKLATLTKEQLKPPPLQDPSPGIS